MIALGTYQCRGYEKGRWFRKLHGVMLYPCTSAGRDIELKGYSKPSLPPSCSEFLRGVLQACRGIVQSFGGVSCSEF